MQIITQWYQRLRHILWAIIVAYMIGLHNMYRQEQKSPDDMVIKIVEDKVQDNDVPKD